MLLFYINLLSLLCFCMAQFACASFTTKEDSQGNSVYIFNGNIKLFDTSPSVSGNGHFVSAGESYYFYHKSTLWSRRFASNKWNVIYEYKPKSVNDADLHVIKKIVVQPSTIWVVFSDSLIKSEDGGQTWSDIKPPIELINDFSPANDAESIFIIGRTFDQDSNKDVTVKGDLKTGCSFVTGNGKFRGYHACYVSYNKGLSWENVSYPCDAGYIDKIAYLNKESACFVSLNSFSRKSQSSWQIKTFRNLSCKGKDVYSSSELDEMIGKEFLGEAITDVYFVDEKTGWMSISNGDLLYTGNGGIEWCKKGDPTKIWINNTSAEKGHIVQIAFVDPVNGVALDNDGTLFVTNDAGQTMKIVPFDFPVESFFVLRETCWFVASKRIYQFNLSV